MVAKKNGKKEVEGADRIKSFIKGNAEILYLNYLIAKEEYAIMRHYRALTKYINDPKETVPGLPRKRMLLFELIIHPENVDVQVARKHFAYGKLRSDEEVRKRVSLIARLYTTGSRLGGEKHEAVRMISEGHKSRKKELEFHRGCEKYYEISVLQKRHRELLREFSEGAEQVDELEKGVSALESRMRKMSVRSLSIQG